ncbi:MarR family transcriptional regulator [Vibrio cortegadensis]|uniref:MarR family winged helix-turn-helix transcriptional regulator n=1 Tax=Vibrio cortegadensis TaxID=1328770 RepID=UPI0021C2DA56|nr:MarR family transcriptional regulator [Vibrio cortegadensis]MDN3696040.1 MarR family transcriptional regulator [Vibrio cortegadensis]
MDAIDRVVAQWVKEKPELNTDPMALMGRLMRVTKHMEAEVATLHKQYDLKMGEFDVLATLRRAGQPYKLTPSELIESMMLTSGAMTNRLDKLEGKGLIEREHSKKDRRSVTVILTTTGLNLIEEMIEQHVDIQTRLVTALTPDQIQQANGLLKNLLADFE